MEFDEEFLLQGDSLRARRNLIISCEDRIALTKSSKGGVKARAQRGNRTRPSEWTTRAGTRKKKSETQFSMDNKKKIALGGRQRVEKNQVSAQRSNSSFATRLLQFNLTRGGVR